MRGVVRSGVRRLRDKGVVRRNKGVVRRGGKEVW